MGFGEIHNFKFKIMNLFEGVKSGIKNCTLYFPGKYAYGWFRTETGVHRLVRKSPFDASHRRHTSFSSVFVYPKINDKIYVNINYSDLKIDKFRSSGAGGQH